MTIHSKIYESIWNFPLLRHCILNSRYKTLLDMKWYLIFVRKLLVYVKISWNLRVAKGIHPVFLYYIHAKTIHTKFYYYENRKKKLPMTLILISIYRLIIPFIINFFQRISWIFSHITSRHNVQTFNFECCIFRFASTLFK